MTFLVFNISRDKIEFKFSIGSVWFGIDFDIGGIDDGVIGEVVVVVVVVDFDGDVVGNSKTDK